MHDRRDPTEYFGADLEAIPAGYLRDADVLDDLADLADDGVWRAGDRERMVELIRERIAGRRTRP
jgi:hypothetical protein